MMRYALIVILAALAGCCTPPPPQVQTRIFDSACSWVPHLTAAKADTVDTKKEILGYTNAVAANCPKH